MLRLSGLVEEINISYTCTPNCKGWTDTGSPIDKALPSSGMRRGQGITIDVAFRVIQSCLLFVPLPLGGVHQLLQVIDLLLPTISAPKKNFKQHFDYIEIPVVEDIYLHTYISIIFDVFARTALQMFEVCNFIFFINQDFDVDYVYHAFTYILDQHWWKPRLTS
jgi:hypothetical protein